MKRKIAAAFVIAGVTVLTAGMAAQAEDKLSGKLTFAIWDNNLMDFIESNKMVEKFQEVYPEVEIEIEKIEDDTTYWTEMETRAAENQLPDIMINKPFTLARFQDHLLDLTELDATVDNILAAGYAVDGKILGVPMTSGYEYVYYWKDMFDEAGVEVPTTWTQFEEATQKLQEFYGEKDADFTALSIGAKDDWSDYPFMEFMPALESGNGQNWNEMVKTDAPFAEGTDVQKAYSKVYDLFTSGVCGKDPLAMTNDEATEKFAEKKAAVIALGDWGLQNIEAAAEDISELGAFYLPARDSEEDPFRIIVQGDEFLGATTDSEHPIVAQAFIEWFFSDAWYPEYINYVTSTSSMMTFQKEKDAVLAEADAACPDAEIVVYDGGNDSFQAVKDEAGFDYKKLGAEMFEDGFDLSAKLDELNTAWAAAREKLEIQ